jgi:hypothetical protein
MLLSIQNPAFVSGDPEPHYVVYATVESSYDDNVEVYITVPRASGMLVIDDVEIISGSTNETLKGSVPFRYAADVRISFKFCNGSVRTDDYYVGNNLHISIPGFTLMAWYEYSHDGYYLPPI